MGSKRADRVADQIRMEIADIIMRRIKDPRIGFVTITTVDVTTDLKQAWVYVTFLQEGAQESQALATLSRASGFIKGELARRLSLRCVPELTFTKDTSVAEVRRVMGLLEGLHGNAETAVSGKEDSNSRP